jgi:D-alanyl-D-alanine carboxypeptidase
MISNKSLAQMIIINYLLNNMKSGLTLDHSQWISRMITFSPVKAATLALETADALKKESGSPAALVAYQSKGVSASAATGMADIATGRLAKPGDQYEIGSQTKMMTATIILQLASEGKIDLEAMASNYLDPAVTAGIAHAETATVRQLLQMTSGIANYTEVRNGAGIPLFVEGVLKNADKAFTSADGLNIVRGRPADGPLGTFNYSNTNYTLLGEIIKASTGDGLAHVFQERIFSRAGMEHSKFEGIATTGDGLRNYNKLDGELRETTFAKWDEGAEGAVVSTTGDMIKFLKGLLTEGKLLPADQLAEMKSELLTAAQGQFKAYFGLGLSFIDVKGAGRFYGFTGETLGNLSTTYLSERTGALVTLDINQGDTGITPDFTAIKLLQKLGADSNGQGATPFDPAADSLRIRDASAGSMRVIGEDKITLAFKMASIDLPTKISNLTTKNLTFQDGSVLIIGDNRMGQLKDAAANHIDIAKQFAQAADEDNQVLGLGGNDHIAGARGNDRLVGGDGHDWLSGRAGNDRLFGGEGKDHVAGGSGNDVLRGGFGNDVLTGGPGKDSFVFNDLSSVDRVTDFSVQDDSFRLDDATFSALRTGALANNAFKILGVPGAVVGQDDHILYNARTGTLAYDADGSGKTEAIPFAQLDKDLALSAADFFVF